MFWVMFNIDFIEWNAAVSFSSFVIKINLIWITLKDLVNIINSGVLQLIEMERKLQDQISSRSIPAYNCPSIQAYDCLTKPDYDCLPVLVYDCSSISAYNCPSIPAYDCLFIPTYDFPSILTYDCPSISAYNCHPYHLFIVRPYWRTIVRWKVIKKDLL